MSCCCGKKKDETVNESEKIKEEPVLNVPLTRLLSQERSEMPKMVFGSIFAFLNGVIWPLFSVIFGELFNGFATKTGQALQDLINTMSLSFLGLAVAAFLFNYSSNVLWSIAGERTACKIRDKYFTALLRQEIGYFDKHSSGALSSSLNADITIIQGGISEKVGQLFTFIAQIIGGVVISFIYGWKMTLVMMAASPLMIGVGALQGYLIASSTKSGQKRYGTANEVATESLSGIRTVYSFVSEEFLIRKHSGLLHDALKMSIRKSHLMSAGIGFSFFFMFAVYSLGFWYGGQLIVNGEMLPGDIITVFFSIMIGAMGIGSASQVIPDIAKAKGAASNIFALIDRTPEINANEGGLTLGNIQGKISFNNVKFAYPTRPETPILRKLNLIIQPGQTVALVGPSGSGKSTVIQLLERFYDPKSGEILVDDSNITQFDLKWFRRNISLVAQEPILFSGTISENILFGRPEATQQEVEEAAKKANAYKFIIKQKDGFNTKVGEKGTQLSGGQKQRVAIARAILKDPKILLLDEATSALDAESEYKVQDALDKLMRGRTTIIIAHRLTTVKNADVICVMDKGRIVEMGNHKSLLDLNGVYANLVSKQLSTIDNEDKKKKKKKKKSKNIEV